VVTLDHAVREIAGLSVAYRPATADEQVLDLVLAHNRYQFPADMTGMTVVDIGAQHYVRSRISNCEHRWEHR